MIIIIPTIITVVTCINTCMTTTSLLIRLDAGRADAGDFVPQWDLIMSTINNQQ